MFQWMFSIHLFEWKLVIESRSVWVCVCDRQTNQLIIVFFSPALIQKNSMSVDNKNICPVFFRFSHLIEVETKKA